MSRHEPELLRSAARVAETHVDLAARLTGRWVTSAGSADSLGLRAGAWSPELLELAGVRRDQFPGAVPVGEVCRRPPGSSTAAAVQAAGRSA